MFKLEIENNENKGKFELIKDAILNCLENGEYEDHQPLPTIKDVSLAYNFSEVTVGRAYGALKRTGYITNIKGKFYIDSVKNNRTKILLVFNQLNEYKKIIYDAIFENLPPHTKIDLQVFHYELKFFKEIIKENLGNYDYYIIMPHFLYDVDVAECINIINEIPKHKLMILDKKIFGLEGRFACVYQDFELDIYDAFYQVEERIKKYHQIRICISNDSHHPIEVINGVKKFCLETNKQFELVEKIENESISSNILYIVTTDEDLSKLIKKIRNSVFKIGEDVGVISYNETILKELLNISVFSSNFYQMGKKVSEMIMKNEIKTVKNSFDIILRDSI